MLGRSHLARLSGLKNLVLCDFHGRVTSKDTVSYVLHMLHYTVLHTELHETLHLCHVPGSERPHESHASQGFGGTLRATPGFCLGYGPTAHLARRSPRRPRSGAEEARIGA